MNLSFIKVVAAISLFTATFIFSMLPLLIRRSRTGDGRPRNFPIVSLLSCFGGGVFMATCLLHLFPDVQDQIVLISQKLNLNSKFPLAEFLLAFGFLLVLVVEQMVLHFKENSTLQAPDHNHQNSHCNTIVTQNHANYGTITESEEGVQNDLEHHDFSNSERHSHEMPCNQHLSSHSVLRSLFLVFALSLHSVFEGLAIGLQSSVDKVIRILIAVLFHKSIIAFTLGLNLTHSELNTSNVIKGNVFFSLTSPLGIVIGVVVVDFITGLPMLVSSGVLQGFAAGTFLYVTFFEVLPDELNSSDNRMLKVLFLILGFSAVSVLLILFPD